VELVTVARTVSTVSSLRGTKTMPDTWSYAKRLRLLDFDVDVLGQIIDAIRSMHHEAQTLPGFTSIS
jgi:hypothetical protein